MGFYDEETAVRQSLRTNAWVLLAGGIIVLLLLATSWLLLFPPGRPGRAELEPGSLLALFLASAILVLYGVLFVLAGIMGLRRPGTRRRGSHHEEDTKDFLRYAADETGEGVPHLD